MVTASKVGTVTTISVDGTAIATINDGAQGVQGETGPTGPKGDTGAAFTYEDFTAEQLAALTGPQGAAGQDGVSITTFQKTGTDGLTDIYTLTLSNGRSWDFYVTNGADGSAGATGPQGPAGANGTNGTDGITPIVTVTEITGGHNVAFNYGSGDARNTNFDVMDGEDGSGGASYTAGTGIDITDGVISVSFPVAEEGEF